MWDQSGRCIRVETTQLSDLAPRLRFSLGLLVRRLKYRVQDLLAIVHEAEYSIGGDHIQVELASAQPLFSSQVIEIVRILSPSVTGLRRCHC